MRNVLIVLLSVLSVSSLTQATPTQLPKWLEISAGQSVMGFTYRNDGTLLYHGHSFDKKISTPGRFIPKKIFISPPSPLGTYAIVQAESEHGDYIICWLLHLINHTTADINYTHYGPERWVSWSPDNKYAILEDPEAGVLQRVELQNGKVTDLPVTCYISGLKDISPWNTRDYIDKMNQREDIKVETLKWETDPSKFTVTIQVAYWGKEGVDHSFSVEVDVPSGQARELPATIDWGTFTSSAAYKAFQEADTLTEFKADVLYAAMAGSLSPDISVLTKYFPQYAVAKDEFQRHRLVGPITDSLRRYYSRLQKVPYFYARCDGQLGEYNFNDHAFPFASGVFETRFPDLDVFYYHFNIGGGILARPMGKLSVSEADAQSFVQRIPNRRVVAYIICKPSGIFGGGVIRPQLRMDGIYFIITTPDGRVLGIYNGDDAPR